MARDYLQRLLMLMPLMLCSAVAAGNVTAVIVFGDSTVDAGNNNFISTYAKSNFSPYGRDFQGGVPTGRFSNGRLSTDFISEAFGLPPAIPAYLDPQYSIEQFASGVCFASAATGFDNATSNVLSVLSLADQLQNFREYVGKLKIAKGEAKAQEILNGALFVISLGTNDFIENYYNVRDQRRSQFTVQEYENYLVGIAESFVREIYESGARKLDFTGTPPMGCLPYERVTNRVAPGQCVEEYNMVARNFNARILNLIDKMNGELPGMQVVYGNIYDPLAAVVQNPSAYGFDNAVQGCCGTGFFEAGMFCSTRNPFTCTDASKYVFFDAIHPTERMYKIITDSLLSSSLHVFF